MRRSDRFLINFLINPNAGDHLHDPELILEIESYRSSFLLGDLRLVPQTPLASNRT